jgi:hypothetical protein
MIKTAVQRKKARKPTTDVLMPTTIETVFPIKMIFVSTSRDLNTMTVVQTKNKFHTEHSVLIAVICRTKGLRISNGGVGIAERFFLIATEIAREITTELNWSGSMMELAIVR